MHCCFVTYGVLPRNAGFFRARGLGRALATLGVDVTYVVDDYPENHQDLGVDSRAGVVYLPGPRSVGQMITRRRILGKLKPNFVHLLNPTVKNVLAVIGTRAFKVVAEWDEPPLFKP